MLGKSASYSTLSFSFHSWNPASFLFFRSGAHSMMLQNKLHITNQVELSNFRSPTGPNFKVKYKGILMTKRMMLVVVLAFLVFGLSGCGGNSSTPSVPLAMTCANLMDTAIADVTITSTQWHEASGDYPAFCQVNGTRPPYLDIEIDVPENWSGRLWQQGGGGFDGIIPSAITTDATTGTITSMNIALKEGLAVYAASNGGNRSTVSTQAAPLVWADGTPEGAASAEDYAYAALQTTREFAKNVIHKFYGSSPVYTYFNGCSNGG